MSNIVINGEHFETGADWAIDALSISLTDEPGGEPVGEPTAYDPGGPNSGDTSPGVTVDTWSNETIEITLDSMYDDLWVRRIQASPASGPGDLAFDVDPNQPTSAVPAGALITSMYARFGGDASGGSTGTESWSCADSATIGPPTEYIFAYTEEFVSGGADGVRLDWDDETSDTIVYSDNPELFPAGLDDSYFIVIIDGKGKGPLVGAHPVDSDGDPIGSLYVPTDENDVLHWIDPVNVQVGGASNVLYFEIDDSDPLVVPSKVTIRRCDTPETRTYYDPLGPDAGLNPGSAFSISWNYNGIAISDTELSPTTWRHLAVYGGSSSYPVSEIWSNTALPSG